MSDATPSPDATDKAAAQPAASAPEPAAAAPEPAATTAEAAARPADEPVASQLRPAGARWWNRRVPLVVTGATLLLGCVLGAGVVAVGALAVGGHGDDRGHSNRYERGSVRGNGDGDGPRRPGRGNNRDRIAPAPSASSPSASASVPASAAPPSPAAS